MQTSIVTGPDGLMKEADGSMTPSNKKLGVFYHCCLTNPEPAIVLEHTLPLMSSQMTALMESGLVAAADEIVIGSSNGEANLLAASALAPEKASLVSHALDTVAELPTLALVQEWSRQNPDAYVIYHHAKSSTYPGNAAWKAWKDCMESVVIWNWATCVKDLDEGFDCVGPHYLTPARYPIIGNVAYFAGNFWVAKASHLNRLPKIDVKADRYESEVWIGKTKDRIRARGYQDHWPMQGCMR